jgi:hypothetical protein
MDIGARPHICGVSFNVYSCGWFVLCFIYIPYLMLVLCPEIGTSSIEWAELSMFHMRRETESVFSLCVLNKHREGS